MSRPILTLSLGLLVLALALRAGLAAPLMPVGGVSDNAARSCKHADRAICRVV